MPTWEQLRGELRAKLPLNVDEPGCMSVVWLYPDETREQQLVKLEPGTVQGEPWLVLAADVFEQTRLDPERALRRNAGMATGAFVLLGERYFIRHAVPMATLVWSDLERAMQQIAVEAVRTRRAAPERGTQLFANYVD
jgi:hypothetical protein